ncbi:MAG: bifunctional phosphopantothenoylcysteine decarboxylase/phosphopantothenate--cysteine ligase CoaBC [Deltaproteobacteria bacterium]|nr:bifunctional phosphopantothenoylcysteine decarboxylase/phosphopantothenate--cysteine ligase CoaBC [Deltaproteobacteria bacterium]MBW1925268.1 bifunctional phosphopantothenoylcysteine decarboxylase/phosphopantothenate--cysteine ligase CoaBC [Deltaproteobacteria bacterium]MBW1951126.1 bifunctional phosphopantothenoylcysteine decarboxylase/phosphopantothenate--cysteine ligase CoaBC [Deltaproteobacteria bacterium]MBW2009696.1 bifunctional phosphopantothenoylcysteine decarboxylase/phosphopantothen
MKGKGIVVGVTGGIAAYKAAELVRLLVREEAVVRVAMTANAARFVAPLTFEALSGNRVLCDMWGPEAGAMDHISLGQEADLVIVAPATANFIGKMANGIGDDFLSTMLLAATAPVLVCPAMNVKMYGNPVVQKNLEVLKDRGVTVMEPGEGQLACRSEGKGRLPDPPEIVEEAQRLLSPRDLQGMRILVTAGPTVEPLDPVRYITNRSSGKMGYAVARAAWRRGASVVLVSGPTCIAPPRGVDFKPVRTAFEMRDTVFALAPRTHVIVKAAAVADYRPKSTADQKIKKGPRALTLDLEKNPDILAELGKTDTFSGILVGFAAETEELLGNAEAKLKAKNLDMIVANDVSRKDAGFETDTNAVKILFREGRMEETPLLGKDQVADLLLDRIKVLWEDRGERRRGD